MTTSMMRCLPRMRAVARQTPSIASSSTASSRCVPVQQARRSMHASPALDPSDQVAASSTSTTFEGLPTIEQAGSADGPHEDDVVHVKMAYLHPSTKDPAKAPRLQDLERGRIRAEPHYVPLSSYVFATKPRRDVLHSAVVYYLDGLRQGTGSTKTRGQVAFSGRKLLPQKGTGKARRGSRGSPLLRKGGVAHGPKPRDFSTKLNRRVRELALRSALSLRWQTGQLHVVKNFFWQPPPRSTRPLSLLLKTKGWDDALFLTAPRGPRPGFGMGRTAKPSAVDPVYDAEAVQQHSIDVRDFAIACGNIPRTEIVKLNDLTNELQETKKKEQDRHRPGELHAYEVLARKTLICDLGAIEWLEEKLGGAMFLEESGGNVLDWAELAEEVDEGASSTAPLMSAMDQLSVSEQGEAASESLSQEEKELNKAEDEAIALETDRVLRDVPLEEEGAKTK